MDSFKGHNCLKINIAESSPLSLKMFNGFLSVNGAVSMSLYFSVFIVK